MEATLRRALEQLQDARELMQVQGTVRHAARQVVAADGATFVLREFDQCFYADEDAMSPLWKGQRFPLTQCISGWAMLHDEVAVVPDIAEDDRIPFEAYRPTFVRSLVMVPVGVDKPVAAIGAYWAGRHQATIEEVGRLTSLADGAAVALERIGLHDAPYTPAGLVPSEHG